MTNEEAIEVLDAMKVKVEIPKAAVTQYKRNVSLDMAIEALRKTKRDLSENDLIRRRKAFEYFVTLWECIGTIMDRDEWEDVCMTTANEIPSAQSETAKRIVGKSRDGITLWYQCDMCNEPVDAQDNFCSGCGRRLVNE